MVKESLGLGPQTILSYKLEMGRGTVKILSTKSSSKTWESLFMFQFVIGNKIRDFLVNIQGNSLLLRNWIKKKERQNPMGDLERDGTAISHHPPKTFA